MRGKINFLFVCMVITVISVGCSPPKSERTIILKSGGLMPNHI